MTEDPQEAFDRGAAVGRQDARLDGHDREISALRTGQIQIGFDLTALKLSTQELAGAAISAAETVKQTAQAATDARKATADALKEAKDRDAETLRVAAARSTAKWAFPSRTITVIVAAAAVGVLILTWIRG